MQPVYIKKADPRDRTTWLDQFIALEPKGGVRDAVEMAHHDRAKAVFSAILPAGAKPIKVAA